MYLYISTWWVNYISIHAFHALHTLQGISISVSLSRSLSLSPYIYLSLPLSFPFSPRFVVHSEHCENQLTDTEMDRDGLQIEQEGEGREKGEREG